MGGESGEQELDLVHSPVTNGATTQERRVEPVAATFDGRTLTCVPREAQGKLTPRACLRQQIDCGTHRGNGG
jgi:hypothetical protein